MNTDNGARPTASLPVSLESETALLGACLLNPDAIYEVSVLVQPGDMFRERNAWIYEAMLALNERREPIDFVLLQEELERRGRLADITTAYLTSLLHAVPSALYATHYAAIVANASLRRRLIGAAGKIAELAYDEATNAATLLDASQEVLFAVGAQQGGKHLEHISIITQRVINQLEILQSGGKAAGIPTGFVMMDRLLGGFQRGDLITLAARPSMGKCFGKGTKVLMYDGSLKAVEDVSVGDQVMGPDSKPRNVLSLGRGREMMYWVHQRFGISYRVNQSHILSMKRSKNEGKWRSGDVIEIPVSEAIKKGPGFFARFKGYKTSVDFAEKQVPLDPYYLGLWLGDGRSEGSEITTVDPEVIEYIHDMALARQCYVVKIANTRSNCSNYRIKSGITQADRNSSVQAQLTRLGVIKNKHIPAEYLINSKQNRLRLLAGLIDSDGHYFRTNLQDGPFEITLKNKHLAEQIKFLCDSLGYRTSLNSKWAQAQTGTGYVAYRVRFNGNVDEIPTRVERKKAVPWADFRDWQVSGITIEPDTEDDYYGFAVDGDHLFLLEDMTVTHNSAYSFNLAYNAANLVGARVAIFSLEMSQDQAAQRWLSMLSHIDSTRLRLGQFQDDEWGGLLHAANELSQRSIFVDDSPGLTITDVRTRARRIWAQDGLDLLIVDYMQLMKSVEKGENNHLEVSAISKGLKALARELNVPVIALSQLNRGVEQRSDKRPMLSDLRASGAIEEDSDVVKFIYRDDYYHEDSDRQGIADIIVAKHRNGATGTVSLFFRKELARFQDLEIQRTDLNANY